MKPSFNVFTCFPAFILLILVIGCSQPTAFTVANQTIEEGYPAVASNAKTGDFLVAYLEEYSNLTGTHKELRLRRYTANGKPSGGVLFPLGQGSHKAIGRPGIAYNPNTDQFFVVVPESVTEGGETWDRLIGRHLDGTGQSLPGPDLLFNDKKNKFYDSPPPKYGPKSLNVVANTILNEFLVTVQLTVDGKTGIWAQTVKGNLGPYSQVIQIADYGINGCFSHGMAYAPIGNTSPLGGRYLFISPSKNVIMFDSKLNPILVTATDKNNPTVPTHSYILLNFGKPEGNFNNFDIAYGEVQGKKRFLIVYSDEDNQIPGQNYKQTGIWATYIDPERLLYTDFAPMIHDNTPFPLTPYTLEHYVFKYMQNPRVAYSATAKAFFVVWRELPNDNPKNDAKLSHIRGVWVDYFVDDGLYNTSGVPQPHANLVLSPMSGKGIATTWLPFPSLEDPDYPDVAALPGKSFVAVWQQSNTSNPKDINVAGDLIIIP